MQKITRKIFECGILPVIKLEDPQDAVPLVAALAQGGLGAAEITFRTAQAGRAIFNATQHYPEALIGAGTVTSVDLARQAKEAGAKFIVTPGLNPEVVRYCQEQALPVFPGVSRPTEIEAGLALGLGVLKFFPAEAYGGLAALKAMSAPYGDVRFIPTGGIDAANLGAYVQFDRVLAVGGSWMVREDLIRAKNFAEITRLAREAVLALHGFQFFHMAVNTEDAAQPLAARLETLFGFPSRETPASVFSTPFIEIMKRPGPGVLGHIAVKTHNVARAAAYLRGLGVELDGATLRGPEDAPTFIYLQESFGGFALHLIQ
jgi:2-dehydro-3-deoxyphosphogluconate aldolase/(4S)-4-hydroxy-2-oxoglutarate aldolase